MKRYRLQLHAHPGGEWVLHEEVADLETEIAGLRREFACQSRMQREMARLRADLADAKRALPVETAWADVQTRLRGIPDDFVPITAYTDGQEIVILGSPPDEDRDPHGAKHDCDAMGCGSLGHVVGRFPHPFAVTD